VGPASYETKRFLEGEKKKLSNVTKVGTKYKPREVIAYEKK